VTARTGALSFAAGAFPSGGSPNAFGPLISFTIPYTYTGGDLLVTVRHTDPGASANVDAQRDVNVQNVFADGDTAATATGSGGFAPVVRLGFAPTAPAGAVPEPGTLALAGMGLLPLAGTILRRRRRRA